MKTKLLLLVCALLGAAAAQAADWEADYARLLKKYVAPGGVKYAEWKANADDVKAIQGVVAAIGTAKPGKDKAALAFYINAYNAWILHEAVAKYPTKSVKDPLFTFFTLDRIRVAGEKMSFNHLEKEIIRKGFSEPRVHFALNCASRSCPPLTAEAFEAATLDGKLDALAKAFCNSASGVQITAKGVQLSEIFKWYKDDFGGDSVAYIGKYRSQPLPAGAKVSFADYDWSLNEVK